MHEITSDGGAKGGLSSGDFATSIDPKSPTIERKESKLQQPSTKAGVDSARQASQPELKSPPEKPGAPDVPVLITDETITVESKTGTSAPKSPPTDA
jgi:hypothetical protein